MVRHLQISAVLAGAMLSAGATAGACPVCETDNARAVRAGITADAQDKGLVTIAAIVAPFVVVGGVVVLVHFGLPGRGGRSIGRGGRHG